MQMFPLRKNGGKEACRARLAPRRLVALAKRAHKSFVWVETTPVPTTLHTIYYTPRNIMQRYNRLDFM